MKKIKKDPLPTVSVVIPVYNEKENIRPLLDQLHQGLANLIKPWELILVDDGSSDGSRVILQEESISRGAHVKVISLQRNFGQTAAMQAGIDHSRGGIIVTLDGDLQNDPADIPGMVAELIERDLDLLVGWRRKRKDKLIRKLVSKIANYLIRNLTGVKIHDYGCTLKVFRASVIRKVKLYGEMHRFIPAWVATVTDPSRIAETVVNHRARSQGKSRYSKPRTFKVILDLLSSYFFLKHRSKPGHFFGTIGLIFGMIGTVILIYLAVVKFVYGQDIGTRPLLLIGVLTIITSIQFITTGIVAEIMARTYFESPTARSYIVSEDRELTEDEETPEKSTGSG